MNYESPAFSGDHIVRKKELNYLNTKMQQNYRSGVGMLLWLMKHLFPDISNATREASKVMDSATTNGYKYLLQIIKYLLVT